MLFFGNKFVMIDNNHWPHCVIIRNKGRTGRGKRKEKDGGRCGLVVKSGPNKHRVLSSNHSTVEKERCGGRVSMAVSNSRIMQRIDKTSIGIKCNHQYSFELLVPL